MKEMVCLMRACAISFAVVAVLCVFSRLSAGGSGGAAYGHAQTSRVCESAVHRAKFSAEASKQDESPAMALLHSCEAKAHASAAKDLADRTGVQLDVDVLELIEDAQERIDVLVQQMY